MEVLACVVRQRLLDRYYANLRLYREAVAILEESLSTSGFSGAYGHAERCRVAFETSRDALYQHTAEHGCSLSRDAAE